LFQHSIDDVENLIKKHEAFEKSAAAQEERFSALERLTTVGKDFLCHPCLCKPVWGSTLLLILLGTVSLLSSQTGVCTAGVAGTGSKTRSYRGAASCTLWRALLASGRTGDHQNKNAFSSNHLICWPLRDGIFLIQYIAH